MPKEQSKSQKRRPDRFDFIDLKGGRSERQCGQSTAAFRTGSAQNGQSLIPLAGITIPQDLAENKYNNRATKMRS